MKKILIAALCVPILSACSFNPKKLAEEYCSCRAGVEAGEKQVSDCREMAESHYLRLQDDPEGLKVYNETVLDCVSSSQIDTK